MVKEINDANASQQDVEKDNSLGRRGGSAECTKDLARVQRPQVR